MKNANEKHSCMTYKLIHWLYSVLSNCLEQVCRSRVLTFWSVKFSLWLKVVMPERDRKLALSKTTWATVAATILFSVKGSLKKRNINHSAVSSFLINKIRSLKKCWKVYGWAHDCTMTVSGKVYKNIPMIFFFLIYSWLKFCLFKKCHAKCIACFFHAYSEKNTHSVFSRKIRQEIHLYVPSLNQTALLQTSFT